MPEEVHLGMADQYTGAMVALIPSREDAKRLAVDGGEAACISLSALGLGNVSSGEYDAATESAVREAQRRLGIKKPNGRASRSLIGKLLNAYDLSPCIKRSEDGDGLDILRAEFGFEEHVLINGLCATCGED